MLVSTINMDMTVPDNYMNYMAKMTFKYYRDKYYPNKFDEDKYNKDMKIYKAHIKVSKELGNEIDPLYKEPKTNFYYSRGADAKKIRNNYDARMRSTNLYIRYLEHKIKYLELSQKKK